MKISSLILLFTLLFNVGASVLVSDRYVSEKIIQGDAALNKQILCIKADYLKRTELQPALVDIRASLQDIKETQRQTNKRIDSLLMLSKNER